jgi:hypothetical protein
MPDKKIVKTDHDLYSTWDVTDDHYCINDRKNSLFSIFEQVRKKLIADYPELMEQADYFSYDYDNDTYKHTALCPEFRWIAVYYVRGGSEGYYVHVESRQDGKSEMLFLGKTLCEGWAGISWAEKMVCAISRIMNV